VIKSRIMRWAGYIARVGEGRGAYRILVGRPVERRPLGRPRRRWEDNIKMGLQEVGLGAWTGLIWLRIGSCTNNFGGTKLKRNYMWGVREQNGLNTADLDSYKS
jgi:hypothetical protein